MAEFRGRGPDKKKRKRRRKRDIVKDTVVGGAVGGLTSNILGRVAARAIGKGNRFYMEQPYQKKIASKTKGSALVKKMSKSGGLPKRTGRKYAKLLSIAGAAAGAGKMAYDAYQKKKAEGKTLKGRIRKGLKKRGIYSRKTMSGDTEYGVGKYKFRKKRKK